MGGFQLLQILDLLKVSKFHKQIFLFSFPPKNEQKYFLNSVLALGQTKKKRNFIILKGYIYYDRGIYLYLTHFRILGQKSKK